jgi:alkaline phosphatase D
MNCSLLPPLLVSLFAAAVAAQTPPLAHGPFRGHVDTTSMHIWARATEAGNWTLRLGEVGRDTEVVVAATAAPEHDCTLHFVITGLAAATAYTARLQRDGTDVWTNGGAPWTTAIADDSSAATIAFGSCSHERAFPEQPIWGRIVARAPHALVLLGDTPYIDLGTVAARRQRHRDFFAFPPVRAALAAIPTWTTWDDHDYTVNDEFGAVTGSETARPVFVDYHAHASYGDGARGIWTRFRRGPIEVFVLDTRTCADTEPSLLAPGERTLLGKAQTEWLLRELVASTATFKVLACGMVWNDGVRPNKKDCWGNWLPERDALWRWLGERRIAGVVLVGGDVHRSRVIVHPTKAVAGYDLPELITSPLAQNVLESNAVPVPGLVFDAGEPHSCLFLSATGRGEGATLRAVFQAGDGREFHTRELPIETLTRVDAAASYRRAVALLREQFGERFERLPERDDADYAADAWVASARRPEWHQAVRVAEPAFAVWFAAVAEPDCRFRQHSTEPLSTEFMQDLFLGICRLRDLGQVRFEQAIAAADGEAAVSVLAAQLALARHLHREPGSIAWAVASGIEGVVVASAARLTTLPQAAAWRERVRTLVHEHLARRPELAALGAACRTGTMRMFEGTVAEMQRGGDRKAATARTLFSDVRRHFGRHVDSIYGIVDRAGAELTAELRADLVARGKELHELRETRLDRLRALDGKGEPDADAAADLGLMLATLLIPNVEELLVAHDTARRELGNLAR